MREIIKYRWCQAFAALMIIGCAVNVIWNGYDVYNSVGIFNIIINIFLLCGSILVGIWFLRIFISSFID